MSKFIHLHTHSHYSLLDGLSKVQDLVKLAKEHDMPAVAITDHGAMYGAIEFYAACKKAGIKPIIGSEVYVAARSRHKKEPQIDTVRYHLTLLAKNNTGYKNLIKLTTAAHLEGYYYKPRVDRELLRQYSEGLIALSGCPGGELGRAIQANDMPKAEAVIKEYREIFGAENYYLEVMHHPEIEFAAKWKSALIELSKKLDIPLAATQDSHYPRPEDAAAHKTLVAISTNTDVSDTAIFADDGHYHFISTDEALELFKDIPEAVLNTERIAEQCNVELELGKFIFPNFELEAGKTADAMLEELSKAGMNSRDLLGNPEAKERLRYELKVIADKDYSEYFLVVADLIRFARESKIYYTVRGSVAGSLVAYLAGITNVNPLEFQLPFERFLNPYRPSAPDIDMDFADNRRGEVIEYAKTKYGSDKVAQIGTFGTMLARGAVRDVARALGKPYELGDRIAKLIPMGSQGFPMTIDNAMKLEPELAKIYAQDPEVKEVIDIAKKLEGTVRHVSVHAAGVVISPEPLTEYVPIQFDPKGEDNLITQYDMYTVGEDGVGLTKLDFLGIRNLAILENAVSLLRRHRNIEIDIENIPFDDERTFAMLARGETEGVFQLNGSGMSKYLVELKPTTIYDINAMVALYRPGPIKNIPEYIARKQGRAKVEYFHPKVEKFLDKSYGILVYQDDLLSTALELAGYTWESVDKFRKAVGKKIPAEMAKQHDIFVEGCVSVSGMSKAEAEAVWDLFEPFQGYGFNKAHAACYGRVAYQTAYMKANFPVEYMCAVLTAEAGDTEKIAEIIVESQRMGIPVLPPDINQSFKDFTVISRHPDSGNEQIRFGLLTIKNLGEGVADAVIAERNEKGPFKSIEDFAKRVDSKHINRKMLEALILSGAMDEFGERGQLVANIDKISDHAGRIQKSLSSGQIDIFGVLNTEDSVSLKLDPAEPLSRSEMLRVEKELLGLYVTDHPLKTYTGILAAKTKAINTLKGSAEGERVTVGGIVSGVTKITTKNGDPMAFVKIDDLGGSLELVVFPKVYTEAEDLLIPGKIILVAGKTNTKDRQGNLSPEVKILADRIKEISEDEAAKFADIKSPVEAAAAVARGQLKIVFADVPKNIFNDIKSILIENTGEAPVLLSVLSKGIRKTIKIPLRVNVTKNLLEKIEGLLGKGSAVFD